MRQSKLTALFITIVIFNFPLILAVNNIDGKKKESIFIKKHVSAPTEKVTAKPVSGDSPLIIRSSQGMSGSSRTLSAGGRSLYISQSIGQESVTGTFSRAGYTIRQGFQQPSASIVFITTGEGQPLQAIIYPNPFHSSITVAFDTPPDEKYMLTISDISGRIIIVKNLPPLQQIDIPLENLTKGLYQLTVISKDKQLKVTIIKH